jgi:hypothetical protein
MAVPEVPAFSNVRGVLVGLYEVYFHQYITFYFIIGIGKKYGTDSGCVCAML